MSRFPLRARLNGVWAASPPGVGLLVAVVLVSVFWLALAYRPPAVIGALASTVSDSFYTWNERPVPENVTFVEVGNESVRELGRWPWARRELAAGLAGLSEARVVGLDMLFSEPTSETDDQALASALAPLPAVGGVFLNGPRLDQLDEQARQRLLDSALWQAFEASLVASSRVEVPVPPIRGAVRLLATLNIQADGDQLIRRYPLAFHLGDMVLPNMGPQLLRLGRNQDLLMDDGGARLGEQAIPVDDWGRVRLNYYPRANYHRVSFVDLLADDWDPQQLQDHYVLVGVSEAGIRDMHTTPVGEIPGPLMHLTFVANTLDGSLLREVTGAGLVLAMGVALLGWALTFLIQSIGWRVLAYAVLSVAIYATGVALYRCFNLWLEVFYPLALLASCAISGDLWRFIRQRAETDTLRRAFGSYVAPALVEQVVRNRDALALGGEHKPLTLLFTDLRDFTPLTEELSTRELVSHLNRYFGAMIEALQQYHGTLDKLMGDAVMGLFNAPLDDEDHSYHAALAAIAMQYALQRFNEPFQPGDPRRLAMGIGISTGVGLVGNIGGPQRFNYTAIGDVVNTAARLESTSRNARTEHGDPVDILICEATRQAINGRLPCYYVGPLELKGKAGTTECWSLAWREVSAQWLRDQALLA